MRAHTAHGSALLESVDHVMEGEAIDPDLLERKPPPTAERTRTRGGVLRAIVLAGGEGTRLRSLVCQACGDKRPKRYLPLLESRTLLQQTLDRVGRLVPAARTVIVTMRWPAPYLRARDFAELG